VSLEQEVFSYHLSFQFQPQATAILVKRVIRRAEIWSAVYGILGSVPGEILDE